jgi:hypothetical protein
MSATAYSVTTMRKPESVGDRAQWSAVAERAVLGAILLDPSYCSVLETARPEDFFLAEHRAIAREILALHAKGIPADLVTLCEAMEGSGAFASVGDAAYIAKLADGVPRVSNVECYARIVREKSALRTLAAVAESISVAALEPEAEITWLEVRLRDLVESFGQAPRSRLKSVTLEGLLALEVAPREMLLKPILPMQGLAMLYSKRGLGKTYLALSVAHAVASGDVLFQRWAAPQPQPVLFVDGELPLATLKERAAAVAAGMEKPVGGDMLRFITPDMQDRGFPDLSTHDGQELIEAELGDAKLLVLDNLSALCRTGKENEGESWLPVQQWALRLRQRGVSVLFVHHAGKGGAQRGTSRREDLLDVVINLRHPANYNPAEGLRCEVHFEKCRGFFGDDAKPFELHMVTGLEGRCIWTARDLENAIEDQVGALLAEGMSVRDIAEELHISKSKVQRIKTRLGPAKDAE